jgi:ubiquinone/menaquinone biosynthesis C-methylase UbiE
MTELELLVDLHQGAERQGPGSPATTLRAINYMNIENKKNLKITDIGCGTGAQTIVLAKNLEGQIVAVDLFPAFLEKLNSKSKLEGLDKKIITREMSMEALDFRDEEFDIIWSEGAIYNIGFEVGIKQWKKYLKPGGYLAVSEITWITHSRPNEIEEHWNNEYPEIDTASNKIRILEENGYTPVGYFILPEECWIDNYYNPIEERFDKFLNKHNNSDIAKKIVDAEKEEIKKYKKYKSYFSYGFYIAKRNENL